MTHTDTDELVAALHRSHVRLSQTLAALSDDQVTEPSYDDGWNIAQVASHLGSGAEIFGLFLDAGRRTRPRRERAVSARLVALELQTARGAGP